MLCEKSAEIVAEQQGWVGTIDYDGRNLAVAVNV
jgi:hypothetical protein